MQETDLRERLKEVHTYSNMTLRSFAIRCGISQPTLDKQIRGARGVSIETISNVLNAFPEISAEWMIKGEGNMLISTAADRISRLAVIIAEQLESIKAKDETISILTERIKQLETQLKTR